MQGWPSMRTSGRCTGACTVVCMCSVCFVCVLCVCVVVCVLCVCVCELVLWPPTWVSCVFVCLSLVASHLGVNTLILHTPPVCAPFTNTMPHNMCTILQSLVSKTPDSVGLIICVLCDHRYAMRGPLPPPPTPPKATKLRK